MTDKVSTLDLFRMSVNFSDMVALYLRDDNREEIFEAGLEKAKLLRTAEVLNETMTILHQKDLIDHAFHHPALLSGYMGDYIAATNELADLLLRVFPGQEVRALFSLEVVDRSVAEAFAKQGAGALERLSLLAPDFVSIPEAVPAAERKPEKTKGALNEAFNVAADFVETVVTRLDKDTSDPAFEAKLEAIIPAAQRTEMMTEVFTAVFTAALVGKAENDTMDEKILTLSENMADISIKVYGEDETRKMLSAEAVKPGVAEALAQKNAPTLAKLCKPQ